MSEYNPKVSIIMPAYNAALYIQESIDCVLNQTYNNWELVIVDDGSSDNTLKIARAASIKDHRIQAITQTNGRQGKARNNAISHSDGELIALLDSDDLWDSVCLKRQVELLYKHKADLVTSNVRLLYMDDLPDHDPNKGIQHLGGGMVTGMFSSVEMLNLLSSSNRIITMTALFKRACFEKAGKFEEELKYQNCEDYDLWLRMAYTGATFYCNNEILGSYRKHSAGSVFNLQQQLTPEMNVLIKNNKAGIISNSQLEKNLTWLNRVLILSEYKKNKANIRNTIKAQNNQFLPDNKSKLILLAQWDILKYHIKRMIYA